MRLKTEFRQHFLLKVQFAFKSLPEGFSSASQTNEGVLACLLQC